MSKTRNNHYVPQWYQEGFFEPGSNTLAYLDLAPKQEKLRAGAIKITPSDTDRAHQLARDDFQRGMLSLPPDALRRQLTRAGAPMPDNVSMDDVMRHIERQKEDDPLVVLQEGSLEGGKEGGQFDVMKLVPNFEMTMYLAQATGSCIVIDDRFRWAEILRTVSRQGNGQSAVSAFANNLAASTFQFPQSATMLGLWLRRIL